MFELHRLICRFVSIVNTTVLHEQRLVGTSDMEELSMCRAVYKLHSEDVIWLHGGWRWGGLLPLTQGSSVFVFDPLPVWKLLAVSVPLPSLRISFGNTGVLHYILLHFIVVFFVVSFSFLNWVCGNSAWSKSASAIFPTAFAHFLSLHHILVILVIFQTFSLLLYLSWWSVINNLWCYYYTTTRQRLRRWLSLCTNKVIFH